MRNKFSFILIFLLILNCLLFDLQAQIVTQSAKGKNPQTLILDVLKGEGVYILGGKFNWSEDSIATDQIGTFVNGDEFTAFPFKEGIFLCTGKVGVADGANNSGSKTMQCVQSTTLRDPDLQALNPNSFFTTTTVLEFDFMATSSSFNFEYVFASEEYPEYVCSNFNDAFGFFLTGLDPVTRQVTTKNIAIVPGSVSPENPNGFPVAINTINSGRPGSGQKAQNCTSLDFSDYYVDNVGGQYMQFDGYTTGLSAGADIVPCETYHMKISVANAQDNSFESGVFIKASSFSSVDIDYVTHYDKADQQRLIEGCNNAELEIKLAYPVDYDINIEFATSGTAQEGVDYEALPERVVLHAGDTSVFVPITVIADDLVEGKESLIIDVNLMFCDKASSHRMNYVIHELVSQVFGYVCEDEPYQFKNDTYYQAGTYDYHYTTDFGCDSVEYLILEEKNCPCKVSAVNAFTPNGDGINDSFGLDVYEEFQDYLFVIYDRWGNAVFRSEKRDEAWDGTINGNAASDGVYYWTLNYACKKDPDNKQYKQGSITLVR